MKSVLRKQLRTRQVHAGWLGEIIGSALGTAVEGFKSSRLWEVFGEIDGLSLIHI